LATMMRVSESTHATLQELAQREHASMQEVLNRAVEVYRRQRLIEETNAAYAALRADPSAWTEFQQEIAVFDGALIDGMIDSYAEDRVTAH